MVYPLFHWQTSWPFRTASQVSTLNSVLDKLAQDFNGGRAGNDVNRPEGCQETNIVLFLVDEEFSVRDVWACDSDRSIGASDRLNNFSKRAVWRREGIPSATSLCMAVFCLRMDEMAGDGACGVRRRHQP
jgi:hypothetical protein